MGPGDWGWRAHAVVVHHVVLKLGEASWSAASLVLDVDGGQRLRPAYQAIVQAGEQITLEGKNQCIKSMKFQDHFVQYNKEQIGK